jgi:hypothetical protein
MPGRNRNLKTRHLLWVVLCFLCCALLQTDCSLCHVAHLVVQPAAPQSLPRTVRVVARVSTAPQPRRTQFFFVFSLFTRPPPDQTANT